VIVRAFLPGLDFLKRSFAVRVYGPDLVPLLYDSYLCVSKMDAHIARRDAQTIFPPLLPGFVARELDLMLSVGFGDSGLGRGFARFHLNLACFA
jgi:hypothetical protein